MPSLWRPQNASLPQAHPHSPPNQATPAGVLQKTCLWAPGHDKRQRAHQDLSLPRSSHLPALVGWPLGGFLCEPGAPGPGERRGKSGQSEGLEAPVWPMERCLRFLRQWNPQTSGAPTVQNMRQGPFPPSPKLFGVTETASGTRVRDAPSGELLASEPQVPLRHTALRSYTCWGRWSREMGGLLGPSGAPQWS